MRDRAAAEENFFHFGASERRCDCRIDLRADSYDLGRRAMLISTFKDIVRPYSALESWAYDKLVAPVLASFFEELRDDLDAALPSHGRVLDVGCGGGHISRLLADWKPTLRITGLDLSTAQIDRARHAARGYGDRLSYVVGTATNLPFADDSFDALVSVGSIKHWPDRLLGLRECVRVVRPGGLVLITETDRSCRFEDMNRFIDRIPLPSFAKPVFRMVYRTHVAGQSIDLLDARELLAEISGAELTAIRTDNGGLKMWGKVSRANTSV
jgi:ubiquinone/menaquinone biosynthesis C-methylase UbiE